MSMLAFAIQEAAAFHNGQVDKAGAPYILHPIQVMLRLFHQGAPDEVLIAALFHDAVEDCGISAGRIRDVYGLEVAQMVSLLTHRKSFDTYFEYIERLKTDRRAVQIKLADIAENMRPDRDGKNDERWKRYARALEILTETK